jgi:hypothetical protein
MNVIYDNSYMIDYLLKNGYKPNPSGNMSNSSQDPKDLQLLAGEGELLLLFVLQISRLYIFGLVIL